jgi:hypothetical protein
MVHDIAWTIACLLVKAKHVHRGSDRDLYDNQLQARTSQSIYKHLSLIVQATHESYNVSFPLVHNIGHPWAKLFKSCPWFYKRAQTRGDLKINKISLDLKTEPSYCSKRFRSISSIYQPVFASFENQCYSDFWIPRHNHLPSKASWFEHKLPQAPLALDSSPSQATHTQAFLSSVLQALSRAI